MHYKSFVTCDDPKGVVECTAFRRSIGTSEKMESKSKSQKAQKKSDANATNSADKREILPQGLRGGFHRPSSFQLLQVSRGAQNLNQTIDYLSKGLECKSHSKDVAKNLLRGALDLQESLLMLGKLQEASHSMSKLKNKQNERCGGVRIDGEDERTSATRFGDRNCSMQLQNPNLSLDGSSKDTIKDLKRVIRDSLSKHNLLPNTDSEEETLFSGTHLDSASDIPSTSSSQSSTANGSYFSSSNSLMPMAPPKMAPKGPSLIAKLMGLDDMPSKPLQGTLKKPLQVEKSSNRQMPVFDIDMPKLRKPRFIAKKGEEVPRKLEDILKSVHFKGLLRSNSMEEAKSRSHCSNNSFHRHNFINDIPPIVLIKPLNYPSLQTQKPYVLVSEEGALKAERIPWKLKAKEEPLFKTNDCKDDVLSSRRLSKKLETKKSPAKRHIHEEGAKDGKEKNLKAEIKEERTEKKLLVKIKTSGATVQKPLKKSEIDTKSDKLAKIAITTSKPTEKGISKVRSVSNSQEITKLPVFESIKHEKGPTILKNQSLQHQRAKPSSTSTSEISTMVHPNGGRVRSSIKKGKTVSKHMEKMAKIECVQSKGNDKRTEQPSINESCPLKDRMVSVDQQSPDVERTEFLDTEVEEQCCSGQSSICNVTELTAEDSVDVEVIEQVKVESILPPKNFRSLKNGDHLRALLLSDQEFLNHVEELFDLDANAPKVSQNAGTVDHAYACKRLSLDCANEFLERRSCPDSQMLYPRSPICIPEMRIQISLDRLVEEVCNGVETLRSHEDVNTENRCDSLSAMLERDLKRKEVSGAVWDLGWRNIFSADDAMHVVNEMERLLLCGLIDEILV